MSGLSIYSSNHYPERIRIRQSDRLSNGRSKALKAKVLFADLPIGQMRVLPKRRRLWGYWVYVAALRLTDGQHNRRRYF